MCPFEQALAALQRPSLMLHVASPLVCMRAVSPAAMPETWEEREYMVSLWMFGCIPMGRQTIAIELTEVTDHVARIRDNGHGLMVRHWDHRITLERTETGCRYIDDVHVDAGVLTPLVWAFASLLFWHRQRRWRSLVDSRQLHKLARLD